VIQRWADKAQGGANRTARPWPPDRGRGGASGFRVAAMWGSQTGCHAHEVVRRCLIVDDNERFLTVARASLERDGLEVVGTATTITEALAKVDALRPDVVLVDIALGAQSGFDLTRQLVDRHPDLRARVVLISTRREEDFADLIAASPAAGFVWKAHLSAGAVRDLVAAGER
jgi:DNA-binding NarL/FixJ family response regulator